MNLNQDRVWTLDANDDLTKPKLTLKVSGVLLEWTVGSRILVVSRQNRDYQSSGFWHGIDRLVIILFASWVLITFALHFLQQSLQSNVLRAECYNYLLLYRSVMSGRYEIGTVVHFWC